MCFYQSGTDHSFASIAQTPQISRRPGNLTTRPYKQRTFQPKFEIILKLLIGEVSQAETICASTPK